MIDEHTNIEATTPTSKYNGNSRIIQAKLKSQPLFLYSNFFWGKKDFHVLLDFQQGSFIRMFSFVLMKRDRKHVDDSLIN